jgi:hypothetical protein
MHSESRGVDETDELVMDTQIQTVRTMEEDDRSNLALVCHSKEKQGFLYG